MYFFFDAMFTAEIQRNYRCWYRTMILNPNPTPMKLYFGWNFLSNLRNTNFTHTQNIRELFSSNLHDFGFLHRIEDDCGSMGERMSEMLLCPVLSLPPK